MVLGNDVTIIRQTEIPEALIRLRSDNIVHVHYKKNTVLDVELQVRMMKLFKDITEYKKLKCVFSADEGFTLTKEARGNAKIIQKDSSIAFYAIIIANNLAYKIIANFYIKVVRPNGNYKLFTTVEEGVQWLNLL